MFDFFKKKPTLSDQLKGEAIDLGLCQQWQDEWRKNSSREEMAEKYVRGIDFAIKHNWPSNDFIKRLFGDIMHNYGVYIDEEVNIIDEWKVILQGKCTGNIKVEKNTSLDIYARHDSDVIIEVSGNSVAFVSLYDNAHVKVICKDFAKAFIYLHGGTYETEGSVLVRDKR